VEEGILMKRLLMDELIQWKDKKDRKPLVLKGIRQCGKTYLLKEFGRLFYEDVAYFNFEGNPALGERFIQNLDPKRIITELGILHRKPIQPGKTLVIFDEIQFCNHALAALKYFCEDAPEYHIASAGSLLGIVLSRPLSFPVGKVDFLTLRPMSFYEFLLGNGEKMLLDYVHKIDKIEPLPQMFADQLISYLKNYYITGGMPEVVAKWLDSKDVAEVETIQQGILDSYTLDFAKHALVTDIPKLGLIWNSIPDQLAKENGKFIYGHVRDGARAKDFEDALQWLEDAGLVFKVNKIEKPAIPLSAYANPSYFKLYVPDVGLLRKMARVPANAIYEDIPLYKEFKGVLTENYVLLELVNILETTPFYWKSHNTAEVDFVAQFDTKIVPFEVKASTNVKARSLAVYREKYQPEISVKASMLNLYFGNGLLNMPLYLLWNLPKFKDKGKVLLS
jgi:uncharacterized protein